MDSDSCDTNDFCSSNSLSTSSLLVQKLTLRTAPSFSIFNLTGDSGYEENQQEEEKEKEVLAGSVTTGDSISKTGFDGEEFSFRKNLGLIEEEEDGNGARNGFQNLKLNQDGEPISPPMYLATGLGIGDTDFWWEEVTLDINPVSVDEKGDVAYYKRMVNDYPCHPLILRNYAKLLQSNGDFYEAEDYYRKATLADPGDAESMVLYAQLLWKLHHDKEKALSYFEHAIQASARDSNVLAAYAQFLWEIGDDTVEGAHESHNQVAEENALDEIKRSTSEEAKEPVNHSLHLTAGPEINIEDTDYDAHDVDFATPHSTMGNGEDCSKKTIEENPSNLLLSGNYAQFLYQFKGDVQGAEEYYSRAIRADPTDGDILSNYAKFVWEIHHDQDKASSYYERAIQISPGNCYILAAYASFLWEAEEEHIPQ